MFSKKPHSDVKKSSLKVLDLKKDSLGRLKHLKVVLENSDIHEAKIFFESNYSHIFYVFYDVFISAENNLKQRAHHRTGREDLELVRFIFEKLLILLPELINRRWQCHSLQNIMKKFLHCGNSVKLRRDGIRLFLLWYQILGENAPAELDAIFMSLVPGLIPGVPNPYIVPSSSNQSHGLFSRNTTAGEGYQETSTFYASATDVPESSPVCPIEIAPLLPPLSGEQLPDDSTRFYLDCLLEYMVSQVCKVEWRDRSEIRYLKCFHFLFEKFKKHYLPHLFPGFSCISNLFSPSLDLPVLRTENDIKLDHDSTRFSQKETLYLCQSTVIRWITHFTQLVKKTTVTFQQAAISESKEQNETNRPSATAESEGNHHSSSHNNNNLLTTSSFGMERDPSSTSLGNDDLSLHDYAIVRSTLYSSRENINMVNEIFRRAFLMHFKFSSTMRKVVAVYREWIHKNSNEKPIFLEEPVLTLESKEDKVDGPFLSKEAGGEEYPSELSGMRLRKDSYIKAIHSDNNHLRAGLQNMLIVFLTNAANVFLLDLSHDSLHFLEEQVDMCKRVLNIYRYMVMNIQMERRVWQQLLLVLLQITSLVLKEVPPVRKEDVLGGRLAPALFQTLIVTWIKANLNVVISTSLWDKFLSVLSSLTLWEELIKEWAKTMETLTRVLAKQVYSLDLNDLPLDRLSEQKMKKNRGMRKTVIGNLDEKFEKCKSQSTSVVRAGNIYDDASLQGTVRTDAAPVMRARSGSGSGEHMHKHHSGNMRRSNSDTNLLRKNHSHRLKDFSAIDVSSQKQVFVTGASPMADDEFSKGIHSFDEAKDFKKISYKHKSKSLDFLAHRAESPCFSESSECHSRSPSPTPSSGLENTSIKDSPMQIDTVASSADNSCNNSDNFGTRKISLDHFGILISRREIGTSSHIEARSIMSGGTTNGWLPDVAVVLWKRMLGALGDINKIKDASVHAQVLKYLVDLSELFVKIRDNLGVTLDNLSTPVPPDYVPPLLLVTPWLFEALNLPEKYKQGKLTAFKLLCILMVRRHDIPLANEYLAHFYYSLHYGLMANDQDMINTIVKYCGPNFFSIGLPGSTLLVMDFIYAADTVISSSDIKGVPRTEAISILGALLSLTNVYKEIPTLQPSSTELFTIACKDAKDHIISILFKAGKREPAGLARCIAINSIGIYLYEELTNKTSHYRIKEAVTVLLIAVRSALSTQKPRDVEFNCKAVARVASDMLLLLCDHGEELERMHSDLCRTVIEVLSSTLENLLPSSDAILLEDDKKLILSLIHCIGEWCFVTKIGSPSINEQDFVPLLAVFKVLNAAANGKKVDAPQSTQSLTELSTPDVDPNVQVENFQEGTTPTPSVPPRTLQSPEKARSADSSFFKTIQNQDHNIAIKLAAKSLLCHLINHLGHFPMGIGASRLTSLVHEHDDVPTLTGDELSAEVFHAPNVQFFILNNCSIVSFVEIPALDMPGGGATAGLTTSKSQVRIIVRDLGGKFSWDSSILYGPPDSYFCYPETDPFEAPQSLTVPQDLQSSSLNASGLSSSSLSQNNCLHRRQKNELPTAENSFDNVDNLDELLQYIGYTSHECVCESVQVLNVPPSLQNKEGRDKENDIINNILSQRKQELSQFEKYSLNSCMEAKGIQPPQPTEASSPFQHCRLLLNQLGFTFWDKRSQFDLLKKNEQLLRELRNLDKQMCRDTHKIAVIYVAAGQEDKNSILSNPGASQEFEEFVAGLGWEVELETHPGFLGGLQRNKTTGDTAPYYATPFTEVIFHVSTRMSASMEPDSIHKKVCHLGNDEVHIVWSEHSRDYRKEIIATEFCDVLIVIYPVGGRMYRIHISRKLGIPFFGPLFNGAIVGHKVLPGLVRATAINANRAKRSLMSLYMNYYEERNKSLEVIVQNHKDQTTFEQFAACIYSPAPAKTSVQSRSSGPPSRTDSACSRGMPNLAAALLDAHGGKGGSSYSPSIRSRTASQSTVEDISPHSSPQTSLRDRPLSVSQSQT
ncbi:ral GTPase-activating protein subunit alpha-1 [Parasteatoda tepidariorum]|uniref:ral GTPase-activating protein subunit alpha-1 n=1 Tax=Parasteatoda tepidariorum TaxID=114398 RepID=UPI001C720337|nr:ral GTPase-activating protein subunit alpha-1 [Parasteatoda tepidariorum]